MRISLINTILFVSVILSGCATAYKPVGLFTGGYSEEKFSNDLYTIKFKGNDNTSFENALEKAMLRASEVGKMSGFKYFVIVGADTIINPNAMMVKAYYAPNCLILYLLQSLQ